MNHGQSTPVTSSSWVNQCHCISQSVFALFVHRISSFCNSVLTDIICRLNINREYLCYIDISYLLQGTNRIQFEGKMKKKKFPINKKRFLLVSLRTGFEPVREDPIGFQVQRLNHSAIAAALTTQTSLYITEHWEQKVAAYT